MQGTQGPPKHPNLKIGVSGGIWEEAYTAVEAFVLIICRRDEAGPEIFNVIYGDVDKGVWDLRSPVLQLSTKKCALHLPL